MRSLRQITRTSKITALALAFMVGTVMVSPAYAQYKPTGEDGITASPRLRQQLDERNARPAATSVASPMSCAKCKDILVSHRITEPKGVGVRTQTGKTTKLVSKHLCEGCGTEWRVAGTGRSKQLAATHTCSNCGAQNLTCCSKGGKMITKGMEREAQIAPVK